MPRLVPCLHAFCSACIRRLMSKGSQTTCVLCSKPVGKVILSSAPMETPVSSNASVSKGVGTLTSCDDSNEIPPQIRRHLPSLVKMRPLFDNKSIGSLCKDANQDFIEKAFKIIPLHENDSSFRLAIAQILKDTDVPREVIPSYVHAAVKAVLSNQAVVGGRDLEDLIQSLGVDTNEIRTRYLDFNSKKFK